MSIRPVKLSPGGGGTFGYTLLRPEQRAPLLNAGLDLGRYPTTGLRLPKEDNHPFILAVAVRHLDSAGCREFAEVAF